jgi:thiol-disulfide isomerase/thioredoxin
LHLRAPVPLRPLHDGIDRRGDRETRIDTKERWTPPSRAAKLARMNGKTWIAAALLAGALAAPAGGANDDDASGLRHATGWLNSPPLTAAELRGKVVLVDFWTYTCINWLRTAPYIRAWADKYRDHGLVVVGVHTPEFEFEKRADNVRNAVAKLDIEYPVAIDNDYAIWRSFKNRAWPALYFVDAQGRVRFRHFGEGEYEALERTLQQLLAEAGNTAVPRDLVSVEGRGIEAAPDWESLRSPETYLGHERATGFASTRGPLFQARRTYAAPKQLGLNRWALAGSWTIREQSVELDAPGGRIVYRFRARDLHLVMSPAANGVPVRFRVLIDGEPPGMARGGDVDEQGNGTVTEQRLYQLIRQPYPIVERQFEIEFLDAGAAAFAFTFG